MVKAEYDVKIPRNQYGAGEHATAFWDFYDSEKQNVKYTYETEEQAARARRAFDMLILRRKIYDVKITKMGNELYLIKNLV